MASLKRILDELATCGITHIVGMPDNSSAALFQGPARARGIERITVTREGEAFALASGLWLGGKVPAVVIQNTGLLESGDAFRGTALRMRVPLLCLITYRGFAGLERTPRDTVSHPTVDDYSRPDLDTVALVTEPTLHAWGLTFDFVHGDEDVPRISAAFRKAETGMRPVAVLITEPMT